MPNWLTTAIMLTATLFNLVAPLAENTSRAPEAPTSGETTAEQRFFLPFVIQSTPQLAPMHAIWVDSITPPARDFVLFRKQLNISDALRSGQIHIFADTRYIIWLDGELLGRGPARFSQDIQEYDVYPLSNLPSGPHIIAVLVEWAPTLRRSVSTRPGFYARLLDDHFKVLATTDSTWKAMRSTAWSLDSVDVHARDKVSPTELLDYRLLPQNWQASAFDDLSWGNATTVDRPLGVGKQSPRSIPLLQDYPMPVKIIDSGRLSPGAKFGQLPPSTKLPFQITISTPNAGTVIMETTSASGPPALDLVTYAAGTPLWKPAGEQRPDVYQARLDVIPGVNTISINHIPPDGLTYSLQSDKVPLPDLLFSPGIQPGKKLLLANPVTIPNALSSTSNLNSLDMVFNSPPAYMVVDVGRTIHGRLVADINGPAGTIVDVGWDERLLDHKRPLPYPGSLHDNLWDQTDSWILDGTPRPLTTIDTRTGRYILIAVWGNAPVMLSNLRVYETRYPLSARGAFSSDDSLLDKIWQTGVNTVYPSMLDGYVDPWRERAQWWGDAYVSDRTNLVAFGDSLLLKRGLNFMAEPLARSGVPSGVAPSIDNIPMMDYAMLWVDDLQNYTQRSGDGDLLYKLYPQVRQLTNYLERYKSPQGLLDIPVGPWVTTDYIDSMAYNDRWGKSTAVNSMYYATLLQAAWIADHVGQSTDAQAYRLQAETVRLAINQLLYDPQTKKYYASIQPDNQYIPASIYAQAWALAYDIVPASEVDGVVTSLLKMLPLTCESPVTGTYAMYWILRALGKYGFTSEALDLIRCYYGSMLEEGATTWWENFSAINNYRNSLSHAWSSSPTWFLTTYLLGISSEDGLGWIIQPAFEGVHSASGILPLRSANLPVNWQIRPSGEALVALNAPQGTWGVFKAKLCSTNMSISRDGDLVWVNGNPLSTDVTVVGDNIQIAMGSGLHILELSQTCGR